MVLRYLFGIILLMNTCAYAQVAVTGRPIMPPPANYLARVHFVNSVGDLLDDEVVKRLITDKNNQLRAEDTVNHEADKIKNILEWSGEKGYLIRARVQRAIINNLPYPLGDPISIGSGDDPVQILASFYPGKHLLPGVNPGCVERPEDAIFIWATLRKGWIGKTKLSWGLIGPPFNSALILNAIEVKNDVAFMKRLEEQRSNTILADSINMMEKQVKDEAIRAEYTKAINAISTYRARLKDIESRLADALKKADESASFLKTLNLLGSVLTFAELIHQAKSLFPDDRGVNGAYNNQSLSSAVLEINTIQNGHVIKWRSEWTTTNNLDVSKMVEIQKVMRIIGMPDEVISATTVNRTLP